MSCLFLVRHAPAAVQGICYGQSEIPVTLSAEEAAEIVLSQLEGYQRIETIYCSPWARTKNPAKILAERLGARLLVDARISEMHFGAWEGRAFEEIEQNDAERYWRWVKNWQTLAPPDGKTLSDFRRRIEDWLYEVESSKEEALAVTHGGVIRLLRSLCHGSDFAQAMSEPVEHLAVEQYDLPMRNKTP